MMKLSSLSIDETADTRHSANKFAICSRLTATFISALSSFIFISCDQQELESPDSMKDAPISIASAGVAKLTSRAAITTTGDTNYLEGGSIGIFVTSSTANDGYKGSNVKWTYSNGEWELDDVTVVLFENNGQKQQIGAYYPYTAELTDNITTITLPEAYGEDYENFDYLYAWYAPLSSNPATITMSHLMAKVTVNLTTGTDIDSGDYVKTVELVGVPRTVDWELPDAYLKNFGDATSISLYGDGSTYCGYALPNEAIDITLRVTLETGRVFTATASLDDVATSDITEVLTSGTHYKISVKVGKDKVELTSVSVTPWTEKDIDGGVAEEDISFINATAMTSADDLNAAVAKALTAGETDLTITLAADAPAEMFTAIRRAICDTEGVQDGSIHLTLKGVTSIPDDTNSEGIAFGTRLGEWDENGVEIVSHEEVTQLASVNLPDVTEIGDRAFHACSMLTSITAPKVQYIGMFGLHRTGITSIDMPLLKEADYSAFFGTALTEVSLPSLETVGDAAFRACTQLQTVDLPKLQNLSQILFGNCTSLVSVNVPAATSMDRSVFRLCPELVSITLPKVTELAEAAFKGCTKLENITLGSVITSVNENMFDGEALSSNITLTLHSDQAIAETLPATAGTNVEWAGFTWKEVKFATTE